MSEFTAAGLRWKCGNATRSTQTAGTMPSHAGGDVLPPPVWLLWPLRASSGLIPSNLYFLYWGASARTVVSPHRKRRMELAKVAPPPRPHPRLCPPPDRDCDAVSLQRTYERRVFRRTWDAGCVRRWALAVQRTCQSIVTQTRWGI